MLRTTNHSFALDFTYLLLIHLLQLKMKFPLLILGLFLNTLVLAQTGTIRGTVIDDATGEGLFGVTAVIKGTTTGTVTDFDGKFDIKLDPGTYDLQISFISYETLTISGVEVVEGEVTLFEALRMKEAVTQLEEIVVSAEVIRQSESALLTIKRKSPNVLDGISSQAFRKIGDGNAAAAIRRVPGVSIQQGKYVYVRGLGDRYTKSNLNGLDIPGLDPDRNTLQMDIFPTNLIDNIVVVKSFTADLPADFTGGVVNIETKDFPDEKTINISGSLGYNPSMHFNSDYLNYEGGGTDWLGFDDGTRDLPFSKTLEIPSTTDGNTLLTDITRRLNPTLSAMRERSFMDYSLGVSAGNQIAKEKVTLGYMGALSYKNTTRFYEDVEFSTYQKGDQFEEIELRLNRQQVGDYGTNNALVSALIGGALKTDRSKFRVNLMHLQNGQSKAGYFEQNTVVTGSVNLFRDNLEYSERSITNALVAGTHVNGDGKWELNWRFSPTLSKLDDKDIRSTPFRFDDGEFSIEPSESGDPTRLWRSLEEVNYASKVDIAREYSFNDQSAKVKFGGGYVYKQRDYEILNYRLNVRRQSQLNLTGVADELLFTENLWTPESGIGTSIEGDFQISNTYDGNISLPSFYVSNELAFNERIKTIVGLRAEQYTQNYTGEDQNGELVFDNEEVLNSFDLFPSVNLIYSLGENANLRTSFSRTIARPSFKETSIAQIFDPLTGRTFIGGLRPVEDPFNPGQFIWDGNLQETRINNFDVRWELFPQRSEVFSISVFYKTFDKPIELVQFETADDNFQPRNVGDGTVIGTELEFRKNLGFFGETFERISVNSNISFIRSRLEMADAEFQSRLNNARVGEDVSDTRRMQGQAPFLINTGLSYGGFSNGLEAGLFYNVQGRTLSIVGINDRADVFDLPFHSLNLNVTKKLGPEEKSQIGLGVANILGQDIRRKYRSFEAEDQVFSRLSPGSTITLRFRHQF